MITSNNTNIDKSESAKFDALANDWWDRDGPLSTLHDINPLRLEYIKQYVNLAGKSVLDLGCGGGILTEAIAREMAQVTGIDASREAIKIARQHSQGNNLQITYKEITAEEFAKTNPQSFDVITCMEMMEHVPDPVSVIKACVRMLRPGGHLFLSTINRNLKAYIAGIVAAEYLFKVIPVGTHDYSRFIRPSELARWCEEAGLKVKNISGMSYLPFLRVAWMKHTPDINYLLYATK